MRDHFSIVVGHRTHRQNRRDGRRNQDKFVFEYVTITNIPYYIEKKYIRNLQNQQTLVFINKREE